MELGQESLTVVVVEVVVVTEVDEKKVEESDELEGERGRERGMNALEREGRELFVAVLGGWRVANLSSFWSG